MKPLDEHPNDNKLQSHEHHPAWALSKNDNTNWPEAEVARRHLWRKSQGEPAEGNLLASRESEGGGQEGPAQGFLSVRQLLGPGFPSFLKERLPD